MVLLFTVFGASGWSLRGIFLSCLRKLGSWKRKRGPSWGRFSQVRPKKLCSASINIHWLMPRPQLTAGEAGRWSQTVPEKGESSWEPDSNLGHTS